MKRVDVPTTQRLRGQRRRLLREYFLNALTLALMKEAGALGAPARKAARRLSRSASPS